MWYMIVKVVRKTGVAVIIIAAVFAYSEYSIKWVYVIATRDCYKFLLLAVPMQTETTKIYTSLADTFYIDLITYYFSHAIFIITTHLIGLDICVNLLLLIS